MQYVHKELYEFGGFLLDVPERILWRGGERIPLSEKAFETLCVLVRHGGRLISKEELLDRVWTDAIVEENNLDKSISLLRQALGERSGKGKFIETVRGHGYRFVAEVREIGESGTAVEASVPTRPSGTLKVDGERAIAAAEDRPLSSGTSPSEVLLPDSHSDHRSRNLSILLTVLGFVVVVSMGVYAWLGIGSPIPSDRIKTVAVLPFKPLVAENRNEALELGMLDALISKISDGEEIIVRPLDSARRAAASGEDTLSVGRELESEAVLDGTIQTSGERIRISARLLRTGDGVQLWAGTFDEKFTDIFALQDSISEQVARALKIRLAGEGKKRSTENAEAYQLYMKGRFYLLKATRSDTETGIAYFQQAIELDPNYALAYTGLSDAYRGQAVGGEMPANQAMPKAKAAALKAIELDPQLAEAHSNLGHIYFWYEWNWEAAEAEHQKALELDPDSPDALQFYAHLLSSTGRHAEALAKMKRARELDPLNLRVNAVEGMLLLHAGQTHEAVNRLQKTLELSPNHRLALMMAARAFTENGMLDEAVAATNKAREISPESSEPTAYGSYALAKLGKFEEANAALDGLLKSQDVRYVPPYNIALTYNALGESGKALVYLEKAFAERDVRMVWLKVEPKWNNLRSEPRFIELIGRMSL